MLSVLTAWWVDILLISLESLLPATQRSWASCMFESLSHGIDFPGRFFSMTQVRLVEHNIVLDADGPP